MDTIKRYVLIFTLTLLAGAAVGAAAWAAPGELPGAAPGNAHPALVGAPTVVAYQGGVLVSGAPYTGNGYFKFVVINAASDASLWSNDGSSIGGGEPTAAVALAVSEGLFDVLLGDTTLPGMTQALTADAFSKPKRYLRVWFSESAGGPFSQLTPDTAIAAVPYALQAQEATNADTLDGVHASQFMTQPQNVVVVAKSGGDYTSVQAAIDGISDASAVNPYLVWVAPGVYAEQVTMKPFVHLQGAGQEATVINSTATSSAWPPTQATLVLASDASLRDLTLGNSGAGIYNVALMATAGVTRTLAANVTVRAQGIGKSNSAILLIGSGTGVKLQHVTALAENGYSINYGLRNYDGAQTTLRAGSFTGRGGTDGYGIRNSGSNTVLDAENVTALGENGSGYNYGIRNENSATARLRGGFFTGRGGAYSRGINNTGSNSMLEAESVTSLGVKSSNFNYGLYNADSAAARLRGGSFTGRGGTEAGGIFNGTSVVAPTLEAENVTALGEDASNANRGLYNESGAAATLRGGSFTGRGGTDARGIHNADSGTTLEAESVTTLGEGGSSNNYGLYNIDFAAVNVTQSVLEGATNPALTGGGGSLTISNSRLVGPNSVAGPATCVLVTRGTGAGSVSTDGSTCP